MRVCIKKGRSHGRVVCRKFATSGHGLAGIEGARMKCAKYTTTKSGKKRCLRMKVGAGGPGLKVLAGKLWKSWPGKSARAEAGIKKRYTYRGYTGGREGIKSMLTKPEQKLFDKLKLKKPTVTKRGRPKAKAVGPKRALRQPKKSICKHWRASKKTGKRYCADGVIAIKKRHAQFKKAA